MTNFRLPHRALRITLLSLLFIISSERANAWQWPSGTMCSGGSFSGPSAGQLCCATSGGDVCQAIAAPQPLAGSKVGEHAASLKDIGSFKVLTKQGQEIATLSVANGRKSVSFNNEVFNKNLAYLTKQNKTNSSEVLKTSFTEALKAISTGGNPPSSEWPLKCTAWCRIHQTCEGYGWAGGGIW
jgi:hypothetical protein